MTTTRIAVISLLLFLGTTFIVAGFTERSNPVYSGKEVFYQQEDYTEFKRSLAEEGVDIVDIQVLSSETPIVVNFEVRTSSTFRYGTQDFMSWMPYMIFGWAFICATIVYGISEWKDQRATKEKS